MSENIPQMIFDMLEKHWQKHHEVDNLGAILLTFGDCTNDQIRPGLEMFYEAHKEEIGSWDTFCKMMRYDVQTLFEDMAPMDTTMCAWIVENDEYKYKEEALLSNLDIWDYDQFLEENRFSSIPSFDYGEIEGLHSLVYVSVKENQKSKYLIVLWDSNQAIEYFIVDFLGMKKVMQDLKFLIDMDKRAN